jgi:hypothetical protein
VSIEFRIGDVTLSCGCESVCGFDVRVWRAEALDVSRMLREELRDRVSARRRFSWSAVEDYLRATVEPYEGENGRFVVPGLATFAPMIGVDRRTLYGYRETGLSADQADRVAVALGLHPLNLWPDFYEPASEDRAVTAA